MFNDPDVLRDCLERSISQRRAEAPDVEFIPVANADRQFPTAGAALSYGASVARHEYLVFAHQDVYLHSLAALELTAGQLDADRSIGMIGSVGISDQGRILGRMRDRVVLLGEPLDTPTDVDSLDEVLFMIPKRVLAQHPLADEPDLAWHAYAVEYGLRLRANGLRVTAGDIPLTHNSLTVNLDRLDVAHANVGRKYPQLLPVRTTCGVIQTPRRSKPGEALLQPHRWRYRWLKNSAAAHAARRTLAADSFVLSDIRIDIDDILAELDEPLAVVNNSGPTSFVEAGDTPVELTRYGRPITVRSVAVADLARLLADRAAGQSLLVTNLDAESLRKVDALGEDGGGLIGLYDDEWWALLGPVAGITISQWNSRQAQPLGLAKVSG